MVSQSEDGASIAPVFKRFGFRMVRGSRYKGGVSALKQLTKMIKMDCDIALAIDGSRGPVHKVQKGVLLLAMHSGCPIVPVNCVYKHSLKLPSWDKMEIPLPFSRGILIYGKPFYVIRHINKAQINKLTLELENYLFYLAELGKRLLR
jgi:hypothetical protein